MTMTAAQHRAYVRWGEQEPRFWAKVETTDGCWLWQGAKDKLGYGRVHVDGRDQRPYQHTYALAYGPVPVGLEIDHLCRNPSCVRPDHLEAVTHRENVLRGNSPIAIAHRTDMCRRGHPLIGANVRMTHTGRACRQCIRIADRVRDPQRRATPAYRQQRNKAQRAWRAARADEGHLTGATR